MVMELFYEFPGAGSLFRTGAMRVLMLHTQLFYELGDRNCTLWHLRTADSVLVCASVLSEQGPRYSFCRFLWPDNLTVYTNREGSSETVRKF